MRRVQVQLDERTYEELRRRAFEQGVSVSACVREVLAYALGTAKPKQRPTVGDFRFIGTGTSRQRRLTPVSAHHGKALADALTKGHRK